MTQFAVVVLAFAGVAVYANSLPATFVFDDAHIVNGAWPVRTLDPAPHVAFHRPVLTYSLALNHAAFGLNPAAFRAVNIAIHIAAALVLFGLVRRVLRLDGVAPRLRDSADALALVATLVWLVHPLCTQAVTYVIQRGESLMSLFYLLVLYCLLRGATAARAWPWYAAACGAFWLGIATKEPFVSAIVVAPLFDRVYLAKSWREVVRRRALVYLAFVAPAVWFIPQVVTTLSATRGSTVGAASLGAQGLTSSAYLTSQPSVLLLYLRLAVWPWPQCFDYAWPIYTHGFYVLAPGVVVVAMLAATLWALWRYARIGFLAAAFFLILAPTSSFVPVADLAVEHRMYLALAPVLILCVLAVNGALDRLYAERITARRRAAWIVAACAVAALAALTIRRNADYRNEISLWRATLAVRPANPRAHQNLAVALERAGRTDEAIGEFQSAIRIKPDMSDPYNGLGRIYHLAGDLARAETLYRESLARDPEFTDALANLAAIRIEEGRSAEAIDLLTKAAATAPRALNVRLNLAIALAQAGRDADAEPHFRAAIDIDAANAGAMRALGLLLARTGRRREAVAMLERSLTVPDAASAPEHLAVAHFELGRLAEADGRRDVAAARYRKAAELSARWTAPAEALSRLSRGAAATDGQGTTNGRGDP